METQDFAAHTASRDLLYGPADAVWDWALRPGIWFIGVSLVPIICIAAVIGSIFIEGSLTFQVFMGYYGLAAVTFMGLVRLEGWFKHWRRLEGWSLMTNIIALGMAGSMLLVEGWTGFLPLLSALTILVVTDSLSAFRQAIPSWAAGPVVPLLLYMFMAGLSSIGNLVLQIPAG